MSRRTTFRPVVDGEVAYQRQLRDRYAEADLAPPVDLSLGSARIARISRLEAERVILKYEWLGTMGHTSLHYGLFFGPFLAGATCVAVNGTGTAGPYVEMEFGLTKPELAILARGACVSWSPSGGNSKLVAWTARLLRRDFPSARLLLAYADEDAGEIGTIYQASNWAYVGDTEGTHSEVVSADGRVMNYKVYGDLSRKYGIQWKEARRRLLAEGWTEQAPTKKRKYAYVLHRDDRELAALVESRRRPYPKRHAPDA